MTGQLTTYIIAENLVIQSNKKPKLMHCDCDKMKQIEVFCQKECKFLCNSCAFKHVEHFKLVDGTSFEKIKLNASRIIVHVKDNLKELNHCLTDLEEIQNFKKNISAAFISNSIDKSVKILTSAYVS